MLKRELILNQVVVFQDLTSEQRGKLAPFFVPCEFEAGQVVFEQGDRADCLYLIIEGEVAVQFKPDDGPELTVARVRAGGVVGWSSVVGSPCYTSSIDCVMHCQMLRVNRDDLRSICAHDPELGAAVLDRLAIVIAERLRNTHSHVLALLEHGLCVSSKRLVDANRVRSELIRT